MPSTTELLTAKVIQELRREIQAADGAELFAVLSRETHQSHFGAVRIVCRGTHTEVPALISRCKPGDMTLHNHPSGVVQPSQQDMQMATLFGEEGIGSMIVDNEVARCLVVVEPHTERQPVDVDETEVTRTFAADGPLAKTHPAYERREAQVEMALGVVRTLNQKRILAIEAGTGTGKSLAYLVPALLWTRENQGRVVIATKTIALQEQLVFKDIPLARKIVPNAPRASLVKGRQNYVCLRKLADLKSTQMALFSEEESSLQREIENLDAWMQGGASGDRADLPFEPSRDAWEAVRSDADMCLGAKCPFFQRAPFYESRRQAAQSKVLIVNQALLFADLAVRTSSGNYKHAAVIPPYEHVVLDESHSIEDIATDYFGEKISSLGLRFTLAKFLSSGRNQRGILQRLTLACQEHGATSLLTAMQETLGTEFREKQERVIGQLMQFAAVLHHLYNPEEKRQITLWLKPQLVMNERYEDAREEAKILVTALTELLTVIRTIRQKASMESETFLERMSGLLIEMDARSQRLDGNIAALRQFTGEPDPNKVPWLELKRFRDRDEFEYKVSPLDVSGLLREALFKPFKSVTMTSATLDLGDNFKFLAARNGLRDLSEKPWSFAALKSPFDYARQARLINLECQTSPDQPIFIHDLTDLILRACQSGCRGGTLVLFTSYIMLNQVARQLEGPLAMAGIELLVQGTDQRTRLLERMKQNRGVLLGTDSFWEGVDLPGDALTKVIISKLPFRQMGDPIFEARCAQIDARGGSSFNEYSLPLALLKFKQGAGRLIRTIEDRGYLIVCDNRIRNKAYGRRFLNLVDTYPAWNVPLKELRNALIPLEQWP